MSGCSRLATGLITQKYYFADEYIIFLVVNINKMYCKSLFMCCFFVNVHHIKPDFLKVQCFVLISENNLSRPSTSPVHFPNLNSVLALDWRFILTLLQL